MEIQTALGESSSSSMQLNEHVNSINSKIDELTISDDPCAIGREEYVKFINKAKEQINCYTQLLRGIMNGSLDHESIPQLDIDIINIHWNRSTEEAYYADPNLIVLDIYDKASLEEPISESIGRVISLAKSDIYPPLRDDLKALQKELIKWLDFDLDGYSNSYSDSDDEGLSDLDVL